jgi:hypothetical protein
MGKEEEKERKIMCKREKTGSESVDDNNSFAVPLQTALQ